MIGDAGIQHGHDYATAGGEVPGIGQIQSTYRIEIIPLLAVAGVIGRHADLVEAIHFHVFNAGLIGQRGHELTGVFGPEFAIKYQHFTAHGQRARFGHAGFDQAGGCIQRTAALDTELSCARVAAVKLDDEAIVTAIGIDRRSLDASTGEGNFIAGKAGAGNHRASAGQGNGQCHRLRPPMTEVAHVHVWLSPN